MNHYKTIQIAGKQVRLHRYLMEQKIGRPLLFNEVVHHKDGDKFNNSIDNLQIVSRGDHIRLHPEIREKWIEKNRLDLDMPSIIEMYKTNPIQKIADHFGVGAMTIWYRLKKAGIKTRKLDESDIIEIRRMISIGIKQRQIALQFNVSESFISNIKHNKTKNQNAKSTDLRKRSGTHGQL